MIEYAVLGGFVLDCLFGDPAWLPHPVVYMGKAISALEKRLRARLPKTPQGELLGGAIVAFCLPVGTFLLTSLVCLGAARISPWLGLAVQMFWCGQALAAKGLAQESTRVYRELLKPDLPAARRAVARIVGRDTENLTAEGVTKAAVLVNFLFGSGIMVANMLARASFPTVLQSPINCGAFAMLAGLIIVPVVSLITPKLSDEKKQAVFSCYEK